MSHNHLTSLLNSLSPRSILVVGDIMLDEHLWCEVTRISPEAPVPVCKVINTTHAPGGAANVGHNIRKLGGSVTVLGTVGADSSGQKLTALLSDCGISTDHIIVDPNRATILKSRVIARHQHVVRVDRESPSPITPDIQDQFIKLFRLLVAKHDVVVISDYHKGTAPESLVETFIDIAREDGTQIVVDPKGQQFSKYSRASILTPNFSEFELAALGPVDSEDKITEVGLRMISDYRLDGLLITRSEKGMTLLTKDGNRTDIPAVQRDVFDITGAGDTVVSMLSIGLANQLSFQEAAILANYAAGVVVGKVGTSTSTLDEIRSAIAHDF